MDNQCKLETNQRRMKKGIDKIKGLCNGWSRVRVKGRGKLMRKLRRIERTPGRNLRYCMTLIDWIPKRRNVVVMNSATVKDLKPAIKKKINDMEQSKMGHRQISWSWRVHTAQISVEECGDDEGSLNTTWPSSPVLYPVESLSLYIALPCYVWHGWGYVSN
ncbi:hypothetical protein Vadar_014873 [Vaccinium darrowii]|uniref:Uncharacterized protein n=1 Tax=Vaccinium darrowii TaxID=229202 RepID=A0ACB7Z3T9_9ERIC|nr:hypothetical protein Vadar_014873 [Vaccinium darrowii]